MGWMIYVTGGAYSGKEDYARNLAKSTLQDVLHITARSSAEPNEQERMYRGKLWRQETQLEDLDTLLMDAQEQVAILDHVEDFVRQWALNAGDQMERIELSAEANAERLCRGIEGFSGTVIVVATEMGLGLEEYKSPMSKIMGKINRRLANLSDEAWFMVSGVPMRLK